MGAAEVGETQLLKPELHNIMLFEPPCPYRDFELLYLSNGGGNGAANTAVAVPIAPELRLSHTKVTLAHPVVLIFLL